MSLRGLAVRANPLKVDMVCVLPQICHGEGAGLLLKKALATCQGNQRFSGENLE